MVGGAATGAFACTSLDAMPLQNVGRNDNGADEFNNRVDASISVGVGIGADANIRVAVRIRSHHCPTHVERRKEKLDRKCNRVMNYC